MGALPRQLAIWTAAFAMAGHLAPASAVDSDRVIVRLKGGAPIAEHDAARRESIAARLSSQSGELMRPLRVMGDGAQVPSAQSSELQRVLKRGGCILEFPRLGQADAQHGLRGSLRSR